MLRYRWFFFFFLYLLMTLTCYPIGSATVGDLSDFLPRGAKIVQVIADTAFDEDDDDVEYLVLYSLRDTFGLVLLDHRAQNRYSMVYHKNLGEGAPETGGRVQFGDTAYTYCILQTADLDGDGLLEFWTLFQPKDSSQAELNVYKYRNQYYSQALSARGDYDIQFFDYQGELVIHEVNSLQESGEVAIRSKIWNPRTGEVTGGDTVWSMSPKDYLAFARSRRRPKLFGEDTGTVTYCWGDTLNVLNEIPRGERAVNSLLPENAYLLEIVSDTAFNMYIEESYVFTYQVPDGNDPRRVLLLAAQADWDFERARYQLTPLPFQAYGLARGPEGNLYRSLYVLPGYGLNHLALLGNGERLSSLKMVILNNNGLFFEEAAVFDSTFHLQLLERFSFADFGYHYEVITADREEGRIKTRRWRSVPEGVYEEIIHFDLLTEEIYDNPRDYKRLYYRVEEPVWSTDGYEELILRSLNRTEIDPFIQIPEPDYTGRLDDYIFKYMTPFRIHQWVYWEANDRATEEALLLIRTDHTFWPPTYRLGSLYKDEKITFDSIGPLSLAIGEGEPLSGVYRADITGDGKDELLILNREYDLQAGKTWTYLEIMEKDGFQWRRVHNRALQYDDLRLYKIDGKVWLFGYLQGEEGIIENAVYPFVWENSRFVYQQKENVTNFYTYLDSLAVEKEDLFGEELRIFPGPPGGRRLAGDVFQPSAPEEEEGTEMGIGIIEKETIEEKEKAEERVRPPFGSPGQ